MTTKDNLQLRSAIGQGNHSFSNYDNHYTNLNLKQNSSDLQLVHSKSKSFHNSRNQNNALKNRSDLNTFNEPSKNSYCFKTKEQTLNSIQSNLIDFRKEHQKQWKEKETNLRKENSTLSLHITAYENNIEVNNSLNNENQFLKESTKDKHAKMWKGLKQNFESEKVCYEFPRQQKNETMEPEIMQFKASQKLLNPNQSNLSEIEFEKLKEKANKLFKEKQYSEAIKVYSQSLEIPDLTKENQAVIYSNRSAAYLMFKDQTSIEMANADAEKAIKLRPNWWRGYYRLGRVYIKKEEWNEAERSFIEGLAFNVDSKEIREELSFVRNKICMIPREEHLGPPQDYKKAAECYARDANLGVPEGMYNLGILYNNGQGVKKDSSEAMKWLLKAANCKPSGMTGNKGIAEAQFALGVFHEKGINVKKDNQKAAEWFEKAVQNGCGKAANNLAYLYELGHGVEKSTLKAFNYYKLAAESGDTSAMINLAKCYLKDIGNGPRSSTEKDRAEGKKWLQLAADKNDMSAVEELKRWEEIENFTLKQEDFDKMMLQTMITESIPRGDHLDFEQYGEFFEEAAKKGSLAAKEQSNIGKYLNFALEAYKSNDSDTAVAALSKAIRLNPQTAGVPSVFANLIEERIKTHPRELDTIICYIQLDSEREIMREYIPKVFKHFPNDEYLAEMMCYHYFNANSQKLAVNLVNKMLKIYPTSLSLLYCRVKILWQSQPTTDQIVQAADAFLSLAHEDHPDLPGCHYYKAEYYGITGNDSKFIECFEAGLAAEKKQLPCFLPYKFTGKSMLTLAYLKRVPGKPSEEKLGEGHQLKRIKSDPKRKFLITQNRECFINHIDGDGSSGFFADMLFAPPQIPYPLNWSSAKKITFKDMDPTKDKIYDGFALDVRIIDWNFITGACIQTIVEDENGDIRRIAIFNWSLSGEKKRDILEGIKKFRPNVKISIINPYHRMKEDGQVIIRVEGPNYVRFDNSKFDKLCHCCGKEAKILPCSGCLMAKYCSKECQKFDWTEFNHKGICKQLKSFA